MLNLRPEKIRQLSEPRRWLNRVSGAVRRFSVQSCVHHQAFAIDFSRVLSVAILPTLALVLSSSRGRKHCPKTQAVHTKCPTVLESGENPFYRSLNTDTWVVCDTITLFGFRRFRKLALNVISISRRFLVVEKVATLSIPRRIFDFRYGQK